MGAPPVKPGQVEALKFAQEVAGSRKLRFNFTLQPGKFPCSTIMTEFRPCAARLLISSSLESDTSCRPSAETPQIIHAYVQVMCC